VCAADEASCTEAVGCASPLVKCGYVRDAATGKPVLNETTGRFVADCKDKCADSIDRPPKDTTVPLDPRVGGELEAKSADGRSAVKLRMPKNAFKVGDSFDKPVNFSVTSVPDSLLQNGAFAAHFKRGALLGALITIEPSAEVLIVGGMTLDIPILDAFANSDAAKCLLMLKNTKMLAIRNINNMTEIPEPLGTCTKGEIGICSCQQNVTHFSTFAVVDDTVSCIARRVGPNCACVSANVACAPFLGVRVWVWGCSSEGMRLRHSSEPHPLRLSCIPSDAL
jgi:hypothetical protein